MIGVIIFFMIAWILYVIYWIMKNTGMLKTLLAIPIVRKVLKIKNTPKSNDEVMEEVMDAIEGTSTRADSMDKFSKLLSRKSPYEKAQYIEVYTEIQDEMKGGLNESGNKGKDIKDEDIPRPSSS